MMNEKRGIICFTAVIASFAVIFLIAYLRYQDEITHQDIHLPKCKNVSAVSFYKSNGGIIKITDNTVIEDILDQLNQVSYTNMISVNDTPSFVTEYMEFDFETDDNMSYTFYLYEYEGTYYVEQPYQGIYETSKKFYDTISER